MMTGFARAALGLMLFAGLAMAEQDYVGRYDAYVGFAYLDSPHISLTEPGVHTQAGVRLRRWVSMGFDFSDSSGDTSLTPVLLPTSLQQQLGAELGELVAAGQIPPGYTLRVPIHSDTQTYAAGPQFSYHRWKYVTPFIRPSVGAIHETATPHPADPIGAGVVQQLVPSGKKTDWTAFYGFGGGADLNVTRHFAIRVQADFVHDHLFNDLLKDGRNTGRFAIGPAIQFGRDVSE
ncbi:MAG TPA: hypothetical protein VFA04_11130 [Bryobacteraceae bacterium]|nr:hypothetical protein [Bryobacteraceae bacterium]